MKPTKTDVADRAAQDIDLFLRLARTRLDRLGARRLPFKPHHGQLVISWLLALAERYGRGEEI